MLTNDNLTLAMRRPPVATVGGKMREERSLDIQFRIGLSICRDQQEG
jgi:hypothetical protein